MHVGGRLPRSHGPHARPCLTAPTLPPPRVQDTTCFAGTDYVDLMLIHWPGIARTPAGSPANAEARLATWRALQEAQRAGKVHAIGVSNFTEAHLQHLHDHTGAWPDVNQIEVHPQYAQVALRIAE